MSDAAYKVTMHDDQADHDEGLDAQHHKASHPKRPSKLAGG